MAKSFRDFTRSILAVLQELNTPYAIGGSVASSAYGAYRTTNDIAISIKMDLADSEKFIRALTALGYYVHIDAILDAVIWQTPFNVIDAASGLKVDFFLVGKSPLETSVFERVRTVPIDWESGQEAVMYSPEDVIIYKLKYFNEGRMPKHPRDILAMLETHQQTIDLDYISYWASETGVEAVWVEILNEYHRRLSETK